jgi:hypothetical protein
VEWRNEEDDHIDFIIDGKLALRYMMPTLDESSEEKRSETFKPYHHVFSPDGKTLLTKGPGGLFPHHRGIFYGFNNITYGDGKKCDTWHCTGKTYQSHKYEASSQGGGKKELDNLGAKHTVVIDWHGQDGEAFAEETREVGVDQATHFGVEGWEIDFCSHLETKDGKPIHLDGDPQHAGFQFRASQEVPDKTAKETYYLRTDGKGKPGDYRNWNHNKPDAPENAECENRPWNALSFVIDGKRYTVLYIDHPDNPKPARFSERDYGRFGSYFVADVTAEKPLDVNYRLWIQEGEMTVDQCNKLQAEYASDLEKEHRENPFGAPAEGP